MIAMNNTLTKMIRVYYNNIKKKIMMISMSTNLLRCNITFKEIIIKKQVMILVLL